MEVKVKIGGSYEKFNSKGYRGKKVGIIDI